MTGKQIQILMRDMLFITWEVQPENLRKLVHERLDLDTKTDPAGRAVAFVSAVCFRVAEVRSSVLPLPRLSFEQVNYRAYVRADDAPAVCFLDIKVNSRMVTALTSFLKVPVAYEDIDLAASAASPGGAGSLHYSVKSAGLRAEATIREDQANDANCKIAPDFITQRLMGYAAAGDGIFRIDVEQPGLAAIPAEVEIAEAPRFEQMGLLRSGEPPHSALYVREALFETSPPVRVW